MFWKGTTLFFNKNTLYKNIQAQNGLQFKNIVRMPFWLGSS